MEWVESLNEALDYIEKHLTDSIACNDVAGNVYISASHFQRTFVLLTGLPVGEYIRCRRLTLAGQELTQVGAKVIDVALKYGYETPESFSKAFSRFHGITPAQAKKEGASLRSFNRLTIKIRMEGGSIMDYKIEKRDAFEIVVKARRFNMENNLAGIPKFWDEYKAEGLNEVVPCALGICGEPEPGGYFLYGIGCPRECVQHVPEGFDIWTVPARTWVKFRCVGPMPDSIQKTWKRVYSEWLPGSNYELVPGYDFESYTMGDIQAEDYVSEIWLPVKEKQSAKV